ncbi:hypothetical protein A2U01_0010767, partial [Trifolium medium]|nr:hypothetical protein [Trifolium medium]
LYSNPPPPHLTYPKSTVAAFLSPNLNRNDVNIMGGGVMSLPLHTIVVPSSLCVGGLKVVYNSARDCSIMSFRSIILFDNAAAALP